MSSSLIVPRQMDLPGVSRVNAEPNSVRYAIQTGFIWSYGEGVHPDFQQGRAWYEEAARRQEALGDYSMRREIQTMLSDYADNDIGRLLTRGQQAGVRNEWQEALFYDGRAAELGDIQGMAALSYTYGYGLRNARMQVYWCRKGYTESRRTGFREAEIDAISYFCPRDAINDLITGPERTGYNASVRRAAAKSQAIREEMEQMAQVVRDFVFSGSGSAPLSDADLDLERSYSRGSAPTSYSPPVTSGFYGNCHFGAAYGC